MTTLTALNPGLVPALVTATMDLYKQVGTGGQQDITAAGVWAWALLTSLCNYPLVLQVTAALLPVPSRPHYLFSIRHVGTVFKVRRIGVRFMRCTLSSGKDHKGLCLPQVILNTEGLDIGSPSGRQRH